MRKFSLFLTDIWCQPAFMRKFSLFLTDIWCQLNIIVMSLWRNFRACHKLSHYSSSSIWYTVQCITAFGFNDHHVYIFHIRLIAIQALALSNCLTLKMWVQLLEFLTYVIWVYQHPWHWKCKCKFFSRQPTTWVLTTTTAISISGIRWHRH